MVKKTNESRIATAELSFESLVFKLREAIIYLKSRWIIILCVSILGGVLGFSYAFLRHPIYTATTTFVLEEADGGGGLGQYAGLASMVGVDLGGSGGLFQGDNILELYKSQTMIRETLLTEVKDKSYKGLLIDRYLDFNRFRKDWESMPALNAIQFKNVQFTRLHDSVINVIVNDINKNYLMVSKPDKKLNIVKVDVKAKDEFFAKAFNEEIVNSVNDFYIKTRTKKSAKNINILQRKADSVTLVMNKSIDRVAYISDATPNLNLTRQATRNAPVQRSQFTAEMNRAILAELVKNLEASKINLLRDTPLIQIIDVPILPLVNNKLNIIKAIVVGVVMSCGLTIFLLILSDLYRSMISITKMSDTTSNVGNEDSKSEYF